MSPTEQDSTLSRVQREVARNALRAKNGIGLVRGRAAPSTAPTPKDTVWRHGRAQLWRYRNAHVRHSTPVVIVSSLVSRSYVLDLTAGNSFIERLVDAGFDVYMFDWGVPDERDAQNMLEDYVDGYIAAGLDRVRRITGLRSVHLFGYCFGGILALLHAAYASGPGLRSLIVMATPVDFDELGPLADLLGRSGLDVQRTFNEDGNIPAHMLLQSFRSLAPSAEVTKYVDLWERLWSDEFVASYATITRWATDHVPFPGAIALQVVDMFVRQNALVTGTALLKGDPVSLADVTAPFLSVVATRDHIIPPAAATPVVGLVGSALKDQVFIESGHAGLVLGRAAIETLTPRLIEFLLENTEHRL